MILSLIFNAALISYYFFKTIPYIHGLQEKITNYEKDKNKPECKKVYSQSEGKVICLTYSKALEICTKNFKEKLDEKVLRGLKTIADFEKLRESLVRICMNESGFDY